MLSSAPVPPVPRPRPLRPFSHYLLLAVGVLGLGARAYVVQKSIGCNDMFTWEGFAQSIHEHGLGYMYENEALFDHPPLMGLMAGFFQKLTFGSTKHFDELFKAPSVLADVLTAILVYRYTAQRSVRLAALAFALFGWCPISILVTGFHGNTDSICACLALLGAGLVDGALPFWGGLALGAAMNVKLIPVLLIPLLASRVGGFRQLLRFAAGMSIAALPFVPVLFYHWKSFYEHALAYRSNPYNWGITGLLNDLGGAPHMGDACRVLNTIWLTDGTNVILASSVALAAVSLARPRWSARELCACGFALFLVLAPGWGVQYLVYLVPALFAVRLGSAVLFSVVGGFFTFLMYFTAWTGTTPWASHITSHPPGVAAIGYLTWLVVIYALIELLDPRALLREWRAPRFDGVRIRQVYAGIRAWAWPRLASPVGPAISAHHEAAMGLWSAARRLEGDRQTGTRFALYRESCLRFVRAFLLAKNADAESLDPAAAVARFQGVVAAGEVTSPFDPATLVQLDLAAVPPVTEQLPTRATGRARDTMDDAARWLSTLVDPRSARQFRIARVARAALYGTVAAYVVFRLVSPTNLALRRTARASSLSMGLPLSAIDGSMVPPFGFHSQEENQPWLLVDLERPCKITKIKVFGRRDCCYDQSVPLALEVSSDGVSFNKMRERTDPFSQKDPWVVTADPFVAARYIRLRAERRTVLVLSEVEVYGQATE